MLDLKKRLFAIGRRVRSRIESWSPAEDREFHDALFSSRSYDPLSPSYPGFLTIRRFADLAAPHIAEGAAVLDLGCGLGEITCELARRCAQATFVGVDHSQTAIDQASVMAARLGLNNATFVPGDVERFRPSSRVDLVLMFDSFHHLIDPRRFVRHMTEFTDRLFLIEPAGDAFGSWRRDLDFDWVPQELDKLRARIEYVSREPTPSPSPTSAPIASGRAVEHRYPLEDYQSFFSGFDLTIHGTIFGLDVYPPLPAYENPWRATLMQAAYELMVRIEESLIEREADLSAKHWTIYAERSDRSGRGRLLRPNSAKSRERSRTFQPLVEPVTGPFDSAYHSVSFPQSVVRAEMLHGEVTIENRSWRTWHSHGVSAPINVSYHWLDSEGRTIVEDGLRTPLPRPLGPGDAQAVAFRVEAPARPGSYFLEIDLVEEGVSWFTAAGVAGLRMKVRVS